ncbi:hypothetical protein ACS0PU_005504 [Formica fusca]
MEAEPARRKGGAIVALRIIEVASFILLRPGDANKSLISPESAQPPLYSNRPSNVFYYKARVLIISTIKAINSNRSQKKRESAPTRCVKGHFPSFRGEKFYSPPSPGYMR